MTPPQMHFLSWGDLNDNVKNVNRFSHWTHFLNQYSTSQIHPFKSTYHHYIGDGVFDGIIDSATLINPPSDANLSLVDQLCPHNNFILDSKHDVLMTKLTVKIPPLSTPDQSTVPLFDFIPIRNK